MAGWIRVFTEIEKIEGQWAVIEWGKHSFKIPKSLLPDNAKAGDKVNIQVHLHADQGRLRREKKAYQEDAE